MVREARGNVRADLLVQGHEPGATVPRAEGRAVSLVRPRLDPPLPRHVLRADHLPAWVSVYGLTFPRESVLYGCSSEPGLPRIVEIMFIDTGRLGESMESMEAVSRKKRVWSDDE